MSCQLQVPKVWDGAQYSVIDLITTFTGTPLINAHVLRLSLTLIQVRPLAGALADPVAVGGGGTIDGKPVGMLSFSVNNVRIRIIHYQGILQFVDGINDFDKRLPDFRKVVFHTRRFFRIYQTRH